MATRFLLGSFEACVAPTFIAIVQMWYRRGEQTLRNAAWYAQLGVVNIVSHCQSVGLDNTPANLGLAAWKFTQLRASPHCVEYTLPISDHLSFLRSAHRYFLEYHMLKHTTNASCSRLFSRGIHMATRLPNESTLPLTRRKADRHRTPSHESARYRLREMEVGPRLGVSPGPQDLDLDSSIDSSVDSFRRHHHLRPADRSKFWLLELPSDSLQHALWSRPDHCYAGRCLCGHTLEGQVALLSRIVCASDNRVVDLAQRVKRPI